MDDHFERMLEPLGGRSKASSDRPSFQLKDKGPDFQPSKTWQGARPGFVFKRGARGVGYYEDYEEMKKAKAAGLVSATDEAEGPAGVKRRRVDEEVGDGWGMTKRQKELSYPPHMMTFIYNCCFTGCSSGWRRRG